MAALHHMFLGPHLTGIPAILFQVLPELEIFCRDRILTDVR